MNTILFIRDVNVIPGKFNKSEYGEMKTKKD